MIPSFADFTSISFKITVEYHILLSTDHSFPYGLQKYGFNAEDLTDYIFAGEVSPDKMYELLVTRWGVGNNLAVALIDYYGGHVYDILLKIAELDFKRENLIPGSQNQADGVMQCLEFDGDKQHMIELLTQISENGFAPLRTKTDREAGVISKYNASGVVQFERATVIGLPVDVSG